MGVEPLINWHLDIGNILTLLVLLGTAYRFTLTQAKSQALRDQKIDIVLFGTEGKPGLVGDVEGLKDDRGHILDSLGKLGFSRRSGEDRRHH